MGREGMGWGTWLGIVVAVVIVAGVVGLGVYGGRVHPPHPCGRAGRAG